MEGLFAGRMVHYVLAESDQSPRRQLPNVGKHRGALVVDVLSAETGTCNLQVFTNSDASMSEGDQRPPMMYCRAVPFDEAGQPGTWHLHPELD